MHGSNDDIIKQDLQNVGKSILNHMNVGYMVFHKNSKLQENTQNTACTRIGDCERYQTLYDNFISRTEIVRSEIFKNERPLYEDNEVILYKASKSLSTKPFVMLGQGWDIPIENDNRWTRYTEPNAEILIVNPTNDIITKNMKLKLRGIFDSQEIIIKVNEKSNTIMITNNAELTIELSNIQLQPGENLVEISSNEYQTYVTKPENGMEEEYNFSTIVSYISLE